MEVYVFSAKIFSLTHYFELTAITLWPFVVEFNNFKIDLYLEEELLVVRY